MSCAGRAGADPGDGKMLTNTEILQIVRRRLAQSLPNMHTEYFNIELKRDSSLSRVLVRLSSPIVSTGNPVLVLLDADSGRVLKVATSADEVELELRH